MNNTKKAYTAPVMEEIGRLDRFVDAGNSSKQNDSKKFYTSPGMYIYFETFSD